MYYISQQRNMGIVNIMNNEQDYTVHSKKD